MGWYQCRVHGDRFLNSFSLSFLSHVKNCNHKRLGIYYLLSAFIFGISGTLVSVLLRIELYSSGNRIISPENQNFYNVSITLHGLLMIFFFDSGMGLWRILCSLSNIEEVLSHSFSTPISSLWFCNSSSLLSSFSIFY